MLGFEACKVGYVGHGYAIFAGMLRKLVELLALYYLCFLYREGSCLFLSMELPISRWLCGHIFNSSTKLTPKANLV